jgi:hypothetical protein
VTADRRQIDDLASSLSLHDRQACGYAVKNAADVDVDHPVPLLDFQRVERRQRHDPGVVDEDIQAAILADGLAGKGLHVGAIGDVECAAKTRSAFGTYGFDQGFQPVGAAGAKDDAGAFPCKVSRRRLADTAAGSCNGDHFSGNS